MGSFAVSLMASCAMHPAGQSPMLTLVMAYSSISPEKSVKVNFQVLKPHRIVHLLDVAEGSMDSSSEP